MKVTRHLNPERATERLTAFAHPVRIRILTILLTRADVSVSEIARLLHTSQPTISHHVGILERAKILRCVQCGRKQCPQFISPQMRSYFSSLTREIDIRPDA